MIKISEIVLYIMLLLPISTLFVNQNISNKVIFAVSIIVFFIMSMKRLKKKELIVLALLAIEFFISIYVTGTVKLYNLNIQKAVTTITAINHNFLFISSP